MPPPRRPRSTASPPPGTRHKERAAVAQEEYETLKAEVDGLDADDADLAEQHEAAKQALAGAEAALSAAREAATTAERRRAAVAARHEALALGLRRKDGTGALLDAKDRLTGLLGPAAELLSVTPGHEVPLAAAFGAAADAVAVTTPGAAAEAIRLLRKQDAGRAALLLSGAPDDVPEQEPAPGAVHAADLVRGPAELMSAVRRLLRGVVVVGSLEDAEELVHRRPDLTAVTAEGDLLGAHFAHGGSAGAPSLLEVQASVDEAAAELEELAVRCEELTEGQRQAGERRRSAPRSSTRWGSTGALPSARSPPCPAARAAGRPGTRCRGRGRALHRGRRPGAGGPGEGSGRGRGTRRAARRRRGDAGGGGARHLRAGPARRRRANARQTEMEARLQVRTHEERVKGLAGRADSLDRAARAEREARARAEQRRARLRHEAAVAEAVASGARQLLAHVEISLGRAEAERTAADAAKTRREQELATARTEGRDLKSELDKLTDSVHRGEVLGAEKRLRIEQLETKALEELGVEPAGLIADYGPDQPVPPSLPAEGEELPEDPSTRATSRAASSAASRRSGSRPRSAPISSSARSTRSRWRSSRRWRSVTSSSANSSRTSRRPVPTCFRS